MKGKIFNTNEYLLVHVIFPEHYDDNMLTPYQFNYKKETMEILIIMMTT